MIDLSFEDIPEFRKTEIKKLIKKSINVCVKEMQYKKKFYISIFVTNNVNMKKINLKYRKKNKVTNVLSFPQNEIRSFGKSSVTILGDVVISLEKIFEESQEQRKQFYSHLSHMIIHSLLHLLGFDHNTKKNYEIMKKKEVSILSKMAIPSPYK
tara:strand:+ start:214 stop:675 length:462 start_codon:yes stop_codon:yes gene_type:complete